MRNDPPVGFITTADSTLTKSDTVNLAAPCRFIRCGGAGVVKVTCLDGSVATLAFTAGETRAVQAVRIWNSVTTATVIEAGL